MENYYQYRKVAELISKEITGTIDSLEYKELLEWLGKKPGNKLLFERIKNKQRYSEWLEAYKDTNTKENWHKLYQDISKEKQKYQIRSFYKYAAAVAIFIFSTFGIYYLFKLSFNDKNEYVAYNQPGVSKALLTLNSGETIELDSLGKENVLESDGTTIEKLGGIISYSREDRKKEKLLYNTIKIPRGGEYKVQLSDGTKVYLNSLTTLRYPVQFSSKIREVEITGEAYFEVTKSDSVPFVVRTKQSKIQVLGTSFNVNAYESTGKVVTTLVEGKVKVQPQYGETGGHILEPSEQSVLNVGTNVLERSKVNVEFFIAWTRGEFLFYNQRLEDIMEVLTRWYEADIFYENSTVKDLRFSGNLNRYEDINQILEIIEATEKVKVVVNKNTILFK